MQEINFISIDRYWRANFVLPHFAREYDEEEDKEEDAESCTRVLVSRNFAFRKKQKNKRKI